ncbi:ABC-2 type transport system ATP-binding protein [Gracilibacillus halotolerans]|uniref:ABC-2 type transport system ATP-binding protein n=1 Tax=Gracilibacillus halotolerans TaxID=74386 RepID=A0A841RDW0_9BACI|nr:ABC transporter ATP-binding protein [Gracilibacillus halotolerans]MBB6512170.1 ABC-2 type transport system ATP-binding protein [Gracilibacillus halotolerans]
MNISTNNLRKNYLKEVALDDLSLQLEGNKIIGLLGKNGAGKTTFMRMLAGHFQQSSGTLKVNGQNSFNNYEITKDICFVMESDNFNEKFSIKDVLAISAEFYPNWDHEYAEKLIELFQLKKKQKVKNLSKGMYSALGIITGLASHAPLTIFDEPYIGLDASYRSLFYDLLLESYQQQPRMIILSTHLIDEVSKLFEEVVILQKGRLMLHETSDDIARKHLVLTGSSEEVDKIIQNKQVIYESTMLGQKVAVLFDEEITDVGSLKVSRASLQELFVYLTKEEVKSYA